MGTWKAGIVLAFSWIADALLQDNPASPWPQSTPVTAYTRRLAEANLVFRHSCLTASLPLPLFSSLTTGMRLTEEEMGAHRTMDRYLVSRQIEALKTGPNAKEGLRAFLEKRPPQWVDSKL